MKHRINQLIKHISNDKHITKTKNWNYTCNTCIKRSFIQLTAIIGELICGYGGDQAESNCTYKTKLLVNCSLANYGFSENSSPRQTL